MYAHHNRSKVVQIDVKNSKRVRSSLDTEANISLHPTKKSQTPQKVSQQDVETSEKISTLPASSATRRDQTQVSRTRSGGANVPSPVPSVSPTRVTTGSRRDAAAASINKDRVSSYSRERSSSTTRRGGGTKDASTPGVSTLAPKLIEPVITGTTQLVVDTIEGIVK